jgi:hypothetical protein
LIEEYANGGMEILANNFCKPLPSFDNLKKFVLSYEKGTTETKKEDYTDFILDAVNEVNKL